LPEEGEAFLQPGPSRLDLSLLPGDKAPGMKRPDQASLRADFPCQRNAPFEIGDRAWVVALQLGDPAQAVERRPHAFRFVHLLRERKASLGERARRWEAAFTGSHYRQGEQC